MTKVVNILDDETERRRIVLLAAAAFQVEAELDFVDRLRRAGISDKRTIDAIRDIARPVLRTLAARLGAAAFHPQPPPAPTTAQRERSYVALLREQAQKVECCLVLAEASSPK